MMMCSLYVQYRDTTRCKIFGSGDYIYVSSTVLADLSCIESRCGLIKDQGAYAD